MPKMLVRSFLDVAPLLPERTSVLLRSDHGKGKSQITRLYAKRVQERHGLKDFPFIDRRLSQQSEGDLIGLPSTDGNVTRFNPPDWFKQACDRPCFIHLDELNRATNEVMQAAFQIVLDYELNGHKLHPLTRVAASININAQYSVNEMDPALLDRFWCVDLDPDVDDWLIWARDRNPETGGNIHPTIIDFIANDPKWLDTPKNADTREVQPSRRSWEKVHKALTGTKLIDDPKNPMFYQMCLGFIGTEATIKFKSFAESVDSRFEGKDILNNYAKVRSKIVGVSQERLNVAMEKLIDYVDTDIKVLTDEQGANLKAFMQDLEGELRVALWGKLVKDGMNKIELAKSVHKHCVSLIMEVFNVPVGEAGIGVIPNIPGIFTSNKSK